LLVFPTSKFRCDDSVCVLKMYAFAGNHTLFDEASREADLLVSEWMSDALTEKLVSDCDTDLSFLVEDSEAKTAVECSTASHTYEPDDEANNSSLDSIVARLMNNSYVSQKELMQSKPSKPPFSSALLTMEARHEQVKQARKAREEQKKKAEIMKMEKLEQQKAIRTILKREEQEKLRRERLEEAAIKQEMDKIRKLIKDTSLRNNTQQDVPVARDADVTQPQEVEERRTHQDLDHDRHKVHFIQKLKTSQRYRERVLKRRCFDAWFKYALDKKVALGKAKALADWNHLIKYWNAWRKYCVIQTTKRSARIHENDMKQLKIQEYLARDKYHRLLLGKSFRAWKKFVKTQQHCNTLWEKQKSTKDKMMALVTAMTSMKLEQTTENELAMESCDESEQNYSDEVHPPVKLNIARQQSRVRGDHKPKAAWQVTRAHVKKLTHHEMLNMTQHDQESSRVLPMSPRTSANPSHCKDSSKPAPDNQSTVLSSARPSAKEHKVLKRPKIVAAMEQRAAERVQRRNELLEKKRETQRLKEEALQKEEEARILQQEKEKKLKLLALKKEKELKEQLAKQKAEFQARMRSLRFMAEAHYQRQLLLNCGWKPWLLFINNLREKANLAEKHWKMTVAENVFNTWAIATKSVILKKQELAESFRKNAIKKKVFRQWLQYGEIQAILEQKADIHFRGICKKKYLHLWKSFIIAQQLVAFQHEEKSADQDKKRLLRRGLNGFRRNLSDRKREEKRSQHVADLRRKVASLLPDFDPDS